MADEQQANANDGQETPADAGKGGGSKKTAIIVLGMLLAEAGLIVGVMTFLGAPSQVQAIDVQGEIDPGEAPVEVPVLHEKFTNMSTGRVWVWDIEVLVVTQKRYEERVKESLLTNDATVRTGVGEIVAAANHQSFNEPGRPTLTRQIREYLRQLIGRDMASGDEIVVDVLLPACTGFPTDY